MIKRVACMAALLAAGLVSVAGASAQTMPPPPSTEVPRLPGQRPARDEPGGNGIAANGRCGGVSFGTGARRCGDATGGPVGGNRSRE